MQLSRKKLNWKRREYPQKNKEQKNIVLPDADEKFYEAYPEKPLKIDEDIMLEEELTQCIICNKTFQED